MQQPGKLKWEIRSTAKTLREEVTEDLWKKHLAGERPLGIIAIREDSMCLWGSIDVDNYSRDYSTLIKEIVDSGLPLVPCRSKSGGLHLFLFCKEPVAAGVIQVVLGSLAAQLGVAGSEIFPKQSKVLADRGDFGSWMVMPYFGGDYDGKIFMQVGLTENLDEQSVDDFLDYAESKQVTAAQLRALSSVTVGTTAKQQADVASSPSLKDAKGKRNKDKFSFSDGPPCLELLAAKKFPEGGRNNAMFHIGVYLKKAYPADWKAMMGEINQKHFIEALTAQELTELTKSLAKKDYQYKCNDDPMKSHCDPIACRVRKHGVGDNSEYPAITSIKVLASEPPLWFVDVDGDVIEMSTQEVMDYGQFCRAVADKLHKFYAPMKVTDWLKILRGITIEQIEAEGTDEASTASRFQEVLEDFLTNRQKGERKEDLLSGRPWEDVESGTHYFRITSIEKFIKRENIRMENGQPLTRIRIQTMVRNLGGGTKTLSISGSAIRVWYVSSEAIERTPDSNSPPSASSVM